MARFVNIQTNFTSGEIDPLIRSRVDLEHHPKWSLAETVTRTILGIVNTMLGRMQENCA